MGSNLKNKWRNVFTGEIVTTKAYPGQSFHPLLNSRRINFKNGKVEYYPDDSLWASYANKRLKDIEQAAFKRENSLSNQI